MKRLLLVLLSVHLFAAVALLATMDMDLDRGGVRHTLDDCIDAYEVLGFGNPLKGRRQ